MGTRIAMQSSGLHYQAPLGPTDNRDHGKSFLVDLWYQVPGNLPQRVGGNQTQIDSSQSTLGIVSTIESSSLLNYGDCGALSFARTVKSYDNL